MFDLKPFQIVFNIFFLVGLSPFISLKQPNKKLPLIISYIPRIIILILGSFMLRSFYKELQLTKNIVMSYVAMTCPIYAAVIESMYFSSTFRTTPHSFVFTIRSLEKSLHIQYPIVLIQKRFWLKFSLQIFVLIINLLVKCIIPSKFGVTILEDLALILAFFYKCIYLSHIMIYIDVIQNSLVCLNRRVEVETRKSKLIGRKWQQNVDSWLSLMSDLKLHHFQLWNVTQRVNKQFGWFLATYPIDSVSTVTYSFYWTFIIFKMPNNFHINITRKKFLLLFFFQ